MKPPPGYQAVEGPGGWGFALPEARAWVEEALGRGLPLREVAARTADALQMRGRGSVHAVPAGAGRWVVRPYLRGGLVAAPLLGDRYLRRGSPRPVAEAVASEEARRRGIATPRVLAGAVYPSGAFYRADLVTEYIANARQLAQLLFGPGNDPSEERVAGLVQAGRLLARLADAGVEHGDLNARNILIRGSGAEAEALLIDLDRCRLHPPGAPLSPEGMLGRLERSLNKIGGGTPQTLRPPEWEALRGAARRHA